MDKFEKLVKNIMDECEKDGEPVSREEAEEMAKMEMDYNDIPKPKEHSQTTKKKKAPERKPDEDKRYLITTIEEQLSNEYDVENLNILKIEREITFEYKGNEYSVILTKHRKPKK